MIMNKISIIARSCHIFSDRRLSTYNINSTEQTVLMLLNKKNKMNQDAIAKYFFMDKSTIAKALRKLETKQLITRNINKENQREKIVYLSEKGKESLNCMKNALDEWYSCIFEGLSEQEIEAFDKITDKMAANATKSLNREVY